MPKLGVNIDHVATLRQARRGFNPDPVAAAKACERAGADSIVCHLREDRRHIQERDLCQIKRAIRKPLNFEMSINPSIVAIACKVKPAYAMLVPEKRQEVTTEGGLDVIRNANRAKAAIAKLRKYKIKVSIFLDPHKAQIQKAKDLGAGIIELHTGAYANAETASKRKKEIQKIRAAAKFAHGLKLIVHAGHGLNYDNVRAIARIPHIDELNIGHAIVSRSIFTGIGTAVREMRKLTHDAR